MVLLTQPVASQLFEAVEPSCLICHAPAYPPVLVLGGLWPWASGHTWGKPTITYFQGTLCSWRVYDSTKPKGITLDSATSVSLRENLLSFPGTGNTQV